jgi:hypothetical protein
MEHVTMTRKEFKSYMHEICRKCAADLEQEGMKVFDKTTEDERAAITQNESYPYRLAKGILLALVANGRLDRQWNAESLKPDVRRLRKIERRYA